MADSIAGTSGNDTLPGTIGDDIIYDGAGNDRTYAGAGNDTVYGQDGDDLIAGEAGNDTLSGGAGVDQFYGGGGNDTIFGDAGNDGMVGDAGDDVMDGGAGNDVMHGSTGNDRLIHTVGEGLDTMLGQGGTDVIEIRMTAADLTPAVRADLAALKSFMAAQLQAAGSATALAGQTTGPTVALTALGVTLGSFETVQVKVDGVDVALDALLNQAPTVAPVVMAEVAEDGVLAGQVAATDADGDTLSYAVTGAPVHGVLAIDAATGAYTYTPAADWSGADSFAVKVTDSFGNVATQTVQVGVTAVADAPTVMPVVTAEVAEDGVLAGQIAATDADGDTLSYAVNGAPANGVLAIDAATGAYTYTPAADWSGADSFTVDVTDSTGNVSTQTVQVGVTAVADAPTVPPVATAEVAEDGVLAGQIQATDADGDTLSYAMSGAPSHGILAVDAETGAYTYTPAANWSGADSFTVDVTDSTGNVSTQTIEVGVTAAADAPTLAVLSPVVATPVMNVIGNGASNTLTGGAGSDYLDGGNGDDVLKGNGATAIAVPLDIQSGLTDLDGSEALVVTLGNVPAGGLLSAGHDNGDGTWTLTGAQLSGLTLTASVTAGFTLSVEATATETNGASASISSVIGVSLGTDSNTLVGGAGGDMITGGTGNDVIYGDGRSVAPTSTGLSAKSNVSDTSGKLPKLAANNDTVDAGAGDDTVFGGKGNDTLSGGTGNDTLNGNSGDDTLADGAGNDRVDGSSGNDRVLAGAGDDVYKGGSGFDTLDFSGADGSMFIDVSAGTAKGAGQDKFSTFEMLVGSDHADTFKGSSKADKLDGGAGDDLLRGLGGADVLTGGEGSDTFQWLAKDLLSGKKHLGVDTITDFGQGDHLDLHDMLKKFAAGQLADAVHVTDGKSGSMVSVKMGDTFVDVVELQGVHGLTSADMLASGMILA